MKKGASTKRSGKRRFAEGSTLDNALTTADSGEPSGRALARRGRSEVSRQGRPSIDVDLRRVRIGQEKVIGSGSGEDVKRPALSSSRASSPSSKAISPPPSDNLPARRGRSDVSRQGRPSIDVDLRRTRIGQEKLVGSGSGLGEPSDRPLARRGRSDVSRQGRPSIDVDTRRTRIGQEKLVGSGSGEDVKRPALSSSKAPSPPASPPPTIPPRAGRGPGMFARGLTGLGLMAYSPAVGEGSDKPKNYPGEGLKAKETPTPAKPAPAKSAPTSSSDYSSEMKRYREAAPSLAKSSAASTPAKSEARAKPTAKSSMATSTKPVRRPMNSQRKSAGDDSFLADLRASAAKMKSATSEMAEKTGKLKDKAGAFSSSFKKGGAIKSRGDGIARRGLTKGRMR